MSIGVGAGVGVSGRIGIGLGKVVASPIDTGDAALSSNVTQTGNTYRFTATRTGDTSGPKTAAWQVGPSALSDRTPTTAADFGGAYPLFTTAWAAGETAAKTFDVTPTSNAIPE
jgi:hypothetical protein